MLLAMVANARYPVSVINLTPKYGHWQANDQSSYEHRKHHSNQF